ncbi:hypothetical protein HanIR_Chr02g0053071 [Helianthus annuus]|nr:hypothetical protein HanIR_Chr02g0053071 [Helianthus annuus]
MLPSRKTSIMSYIFLSAFDWICISITRLDHKIRVFYFIFFFNLEIFYFLFFIFTSHIFHSNHQGKLHKDSR